jgi:integrase/recombinase XerD
MNLHEAVEAYIALKRALGARFDSQARMLRAFCRSVGEIDVANVKPDAVLAFLAARDPSQAHGSRRPRCCAASIAMPLRAA